MKKKNTKNALVIVLALLLVIIYPKNANAVSNINNSDTRDATTVFVEVENQQELNDLLNQIEIHNQKSSLLWENSKLREVPYTELAYRTNEFNDMVSLRSVRTVFAFATSHVNSLGIFPKYYTYSVSYQLQDERNIIGMNWLQLSPNSSDLQTTLNGYSHRILDGMRTLAINTSVRIGIINTANGSVTYVSKSDYIEFYYDGNHRVY